MSGTFVPFPTPLHQGKFIRRYKRFFADFELDGETVVAHCANTGSMKGLLVEGSPGMIWDCNDPKKKLKYRWYAVQIEGVWVGIYTQLPNGFVAQAIEDGAIPSLKDATLIEREKKMGDKSRVDILAHGPWGRCFVEVKNVTLVEDSRALFPDAVTSRGLKHIHELVARIEEGDRAAMVYLVQRGDARSFSPAEAIDPAYTKALREAQTKGLEIYAMGTEVSPEGVRFKELLPIILEPGEG